MSDRSKNKYPPSPFDDAAALELPQNSALAHEFDSLAAFYTMSGDWLRRAEQTLSKGASKTVVDVETLRDLLTLVRSLAAHRLSTLQSKIEDATARGRRRGPWPSMVALERRYLAEQGQQPVRKKPGPRTDFDWTEEKVRALDHEAAAEKKRCGKRPTDRSLVVRQMMKELAGTGRRIRKRDVDNRCKRLSDARNRFKIRIRR